MTWVLVVLVTSTVTVPQEFLKYYYLRANSWKSFEVESISVSPWKDEKACNAAKKAVLRVKKDAKAECRHI